MNNALEIFLSGFKTLHCTESDLLRDFNDIFQATDDGENVTLILLDIFAAFDSVDHAISLSRLRDLGVCGVAHDWF